MIKYFEIFENSLFSNLKKVEAIRKEEQKKGQYYAYEGDCEDELMKYIGFDKKNEDEFEVEYWGMQPDLFTIHFKEGFIERFLDLEQGIFNFATQFGGYNNYEVTVGKDELEYLSNYISEDNIKEAKKINKIIRC